MPSVPDETVKLLRAAQGGDRQALEELFERYQPRVRQIVALRVGRRLRQLEELDDIAQDALLQAFRGLDRFEERSEGSFRNWLAACVECEIRMHLRAAGTRKRGGGKVRRFGEVESALLVSSIFAGKEPSPSEVARAGELAERIEAALLEMPEHQRELIILRSLCDMPYAEVAAALHLDHEHTARKAYSRALKKLKEALGM